MESHGGGVELVRLEDGVAHLRLRGSCDGCPASASTLELAIREALDEAAPDLDGIEVEGLVEAKQPKRLFPLAGQTASGQPTWVELAGVAGLETGAMTQAQVGVVPLLVANVGGTLLAYRNACAGCGAPLHRAELDGGLLTCPAAGVASSCRSRAARSARTSSSRRFRCSRTAGTSGSRSRDRRRARSGSCAGWPTGSVDRPRRRPRPSPRSAATSARRRSRPTTATCSTSRSGGSSARARRAARSSPVTARTGRPGLADRLARRARAPGRALGVIPDPDRARVLLRAAARPAASSPSTRARPGRPSASSTSGPGRSSSPRTRCSTGSRPTSRP